jgi:hypothetical protein
MDHACKRRHVFTTFVVGVLSDDAIVLHRK